MWLFYLYEGLAFIAVIAAIIFYCRYRGLGFFSFVWKHLKWVSISILVIWAVIAILCFSHISAAINCYSRGVSLRSTTKYSMVYSECQIQTPKGSFIPLEKLRSNSDGKAGKDDGSATESLEDGLYFDSDTN